MPLTTWAKSFPFNVAHFRMSGLNSMYRPFMSLPSICFMPQLNETRTCQALAAISNYNRTACDDYEALKLRLVNVIPFRILLLKFYPLGLIF